MKQILWINNNDTDRSYMLEKTEESHTGIGQAAIEKDWWVSVTLKALFQTDCAESLIFKGGTSLSKGWGLIERFSEDIDLAISHSFFGVNKSNKSQRDKLRKLSRAYIQSTLPRVKIEISCLSMDEPVEEREIRSLICETFPDDDTDAVCRIKTVVPTRTFLEKIFLLAEEFQKDKPRSMRMSRHLYDLERLMDSEFGKSALADKTLYNTIIEHRQAYYAIRYVDYSLHHPDTINILPPENVQDDWRQDYSNMQRYFIYGRSLDFDHLMQRIQELQQRLRCM